MKSGSDRVVQQCKDNLFSIETLKDFQFIDKDGKDNGQTGIASFCLVLKRIFSHPHPLFSFPLSLSLSASIV